MQDPNDPYKGAYDAEHILFVSDQSDKSGGDLLQQLQLVSDAASSLQAVTWHIHIHVHMHVCVS